MKRLFVFQSNKVVACSEDKAVIIEENSSCSTNSREKYKFSILKHLFGPLD